LWVKMMITAIIIKFGLRLDKAVKYLLRGPRRMKTFHRMGYRLILPPSFLLILLGSKKPLTFLSNRLTLPTNKKTLRGIARGLVLAVTQSISNRLLNNRNKETRIVTVVREVNQ
jgi:hypothetical protein